MIKRLFIGVFLVAIILVLTGCGNSDKKNGKYAINFGETKNMGDTIELTVKSNRAIKQIEPPNITTIVYRGFRADDGYKYLDIIAEVKNISSKSITMGEICDSKLEIGKDTYEITYIAEEENGSWLNGNGSGKKLEQNETARYHIAAEIEESRFSSDFTATLIMNLQGKKYTYDMKVVNAERNNADESSTVYLLNKGQEIKENELVTIDNSCEFTINSNQFVKVVEPTTPKGIYHYLNAGEGKKYLNIKVTVKNTQDIAVKQSSLLGSVKVVYGDDEYKCTKVTENEDGTNINANTGANDIEASATMKYFILAKVPEEIETSTEPLYVTFTINGKNYSYNIR